MNILLILGCNGFTGSDNFCYCHGVNNPVLKLSECDKELSEKMINFFDNACGLFEMPINDYNKCMNTLSILYRDYKVISPEMLHNIQAFARQHKSCGLYLSLILSEDYYG